ncbi:bifunctional glutamate N-acetyltransferase/amino-acid acetyltransferase ArgJ [Amaricoccus sp.]|uniref:bifunctional glutamate N-acetyltransferase/amino-acid acetyltransferase ArgJ n=1 Tax=Amaricoccus sp. TaxID=1872485 RepID=UPI001B749C96|nr:bifunctional glutamate N-acetyltransferase/amino-acid acetyltransferase ArgJ [Amaricoccus sp.]MBP7243241.1 bifunctional glutamate N-acetyltransferase/amino-acid acetyltransferase ArgJ [Amaricoccus sp.]
MAKGALPVSPLAPAGGFPALPVVAGVRFAAIAAGVRYPGRDDVMLVEIEAGAAAAGVLTRSATRSAPVLWCERCLAGQRGSDAGFAVLANSGNSNAFTGGAGRAAVTATVEAVGRALGLTPERVFVASTGVIGEPLPAARIVARVDALAAALSPSAGEAAARAIMTTDTFAKGAAARTEIDGAPVAIAGFAKGSGMIAPDMATMLAFVFTDAAVEHDLLQRLLSEINARTFNCVTVDGDTSTSDTLLLFATGKAAMAPLAAEDDPRLPAFRDALEGVIRDLALQVVRDGEGASKFVEINVTGAASDEDAAKVARSIANSPLVKTAIAGEDPNWGRVVMAVGKSGAAADRDTLAIRFGQVLVAERGMVSPEYVEAEAAAHMKGQEIGIGVDLGIGGGKATVWTCDLTRAYIDINADYRS